MQKKDTEWCDVGLREISPVPQATQSRSEDDVPSKKTRKPGRQVLQLSQLSAFSTDENLPVDHVRALVSRTRESPRDGCVWLLGLSRTWGADCADCVAR